MTGRPEITREMIDLYDEYTHVTLDRRGFMARLAILAGGTAAATTIFQMLASDYAKAETIAPDDQRIKTEDVTFPGPAGDIKGYLVQPANASGKLPTVLVIHENRGLNPHIKDVTRRFGTEGFLALAVDLLSRQGGTPPSDEEAAKLFQSIDRSGTVADTQAALSWVKQRPESNGKVGAVGFCFGGGIVNQLAVAAGGDLNAGVAYYGGQPPAADVPRIKARLLLQYGGLDTRVNAGIPAYEDALKAAGVDYRIFIYEGANHAFNNDTSAERYNKEAADLAWSRTLAFFRDSLA
jgi:carboxymethylenebutenolidase